VIEERLFNAAADWFPATPAIAEGARQRLPARPDPAPRLATRTVVIAFATLVLVGSAVAATVLDVIPGIRLRHIERLPATALVQPLDAGRPVTLTEAKRIVPFTLLLPSGLAETPRYFIDRDQAHKPVFTAVYGSGLVLTEWTSGPVLFDKLLTYEGRTEYVDVGGAPGIWIDGPEHAVFYLGLSGHEHRIGGRLAGNVLVWQRNTRSYRLEADVSRKRALELAASLEPR
jgi:hypothetical protein